MRKLTTNEFISMAKIVHGDKFLYTCSKYIKSTELVEIECRTHGIISLLANNHLRGQGCGRCAKENIGLKVKEAATKRRSDVIISEDGKSIKIPLTKGKYAIVDYDIYYLFKPYNWCFLNTGYATTTLRNGKQILMHTLIAKKIFKVGLLDHINRNGLDNRVLNLREATDQQNSCNTCSAKNSTSKFKGVFWNKKLEKWQSKIEKSGNYYHLGTYENEEKAALSYNIKALELFGEFAFINKI